MYKKIQIQVYTILYHINHLQRLKRLQVTVDPKGQGGPLGQARQLHVGGRFGGTENDEVRHIEMTRHLRSVFGRFFGGTQQQICLENARIDKNV